MKMAYKGPKICSISGPDILSSKVGDVQFDAVKGAYKTLQHKCLDYLTSLE